MVCLRGERPPQSQTHTQAKKRMSLARARLNFKRGETLYRIKICSNSEDTRSSCLRRERVHRGVLLKSGMGRDRRGTSRPVPATKIRDRTERETGQAGLFFFVFSR